MSERSKQSRWQKGQSGNVNGRPLQGRAMAQALRETAEMCVPEGKHAGAITLREQLAAMIWQGVTSGTVTFAGGRDLALNGREWLELVRWLHQHVEGTAHTAGKDNAPYSAEPSPEQVVIEYIDGDEEEDEADEDYTYLPTPPLLG